MSHCRLQKIGYKYLIGLGLLQDLDNNVNNLLDLGRQTLTALKLIQNDEDNHKKISKLMDNSFQNMCIIDLTHFKFFKQQRGC